MNINFELADLRGFVAVAELGGFRAAAESLPLSQPALSRRIEKLEKALGARLFDRTTRRVTLTGVGRDFWPKARALLDGLEQSLLGIQEFATARMGEVTIACVSSAVYYFLPRVVRRYHEMYPGIRLRILDDGANEVMSRVLRGEADFGVYFLGTQEPEVDFQPILRERFVAACRRDHPLARRRKVTWAELSNYDYMTVSNSSGNRLLIDAALANYASRPRWLYEVRHVATLLGLVEAGLGIAAVPQLAMPESGHPTLASVSLTEPLLTRTLGLIRRRGHSLSPAAQQLYTLIEEARPRKLPKAGAGQKVSA